MSWQKIILFSWYLLCVLFLFFCVKSTLLDSYVSEQINSNCLYIAHLHVCRFGYFNHCDSTRYLRRYYLQSTKKNKRKINRGMRWGVWNALLSFEKLVYSNSIQLKVLWKLWVRGKYRNVAASFLLLSLDFYGFFYKSISVFCAKLELNCWASKTQIPSQNKRKVKTYIQISVFESHLESIFGYIRTNSECMCSFVCVFVSLERVTWNWFKLRIPYIWIK